MTDALKTIKKNDWTWNITDPLILDAWFAEFRTRIDDAVIKRNANRIVFLVREKDSVYYVKYDKPKATGQKVKSLFRSKVKSEYKSYELLKENGVPVVDYLGWGQKGSEGMLISRALPDSVNAKHFWFTKCLMADHDELRARFLAVFTDFLKSFFKSGLYHPDFHIGNLLYQPRQNRLFLVDPYGVRSTRLDRKKLFSMFRIIGALRGELNREEAVSVIGQANMVANFADGGVLWEQILSAEAEEIRKLWPKRKEQILSGNSKYTKAIEKDGRKYVLRISQGGKFYVPENELAASLRTLRQQENDHREAEEAWLESFQRDFHRLHHQMPVVWEVGDSEQNVLYFMPETDQNRLSQREFDERLKIAGFGK